MSPSKNKPHKKGHWKALGLIFGILQYNPFGSILNYLGKLVHIEKLKIVLRIEA